MSTRADVRRPIGKKLPIYYSNKKERIDSAT